MESFPYRINLIGFQLMLRIMFGTYIAPSIIRSLPALAG
jgi:hypothetical protein